MSNQEPLRTQRELPKEPGQGTVLQNRYRLQRLLGAGGMGHAWLAEDSMRRIDGGAAQVVVKLLPPDLRRNVDANNDFRREYGKVWLLSHPHICKLFDMGEDRAAGCFQVMQYLPGGRHYGTCCVRSVNLSGWLLMRCCRLSRRADQHWTMRTGSECCIGMSNRKT